MRVLEPRRVVERYVAEVLNGADPPSAAELIANETLGQRVAGFRVAFPDVQVKTETMLAEGELVAVHMTGRGIHQGIFHGCPPTGREWAATCTAIYRVTGGRITDSRVNWDLLSVLEQLGAIRRSASVSA